MPSRIGNAVIVSAPSGAGKSALILWAVAQQPDALVFSVSDTTRPARPGEEDGREYHFVTPERFHSGIAADEFLEWAEVHGHLYGTPRAAAVSAFASGRDVIFDVDVQGAAALRKALDHPVSIFILPPSFEALEARLRDRKTEDETRISRRLETARREILSYREFDYVIVNDDLPAARRGFLDVVAAARQRRVRMGPLLEPILASFRGRTAPGPGSTA